MNKNKNVHDVKGWQIDCINFKPCPLCYGCRNADPKFLKCLKCMENSFDICNIKLHTEENISRMITREVINLDK